MFLDEISIYNMEHFGLSSNADTCSVVVKEVRDMRLGYRVSSKSCGFTHFRVEY
jgi:hypothetical protein